MTEARQIPDSMRLVRITPRAVGLWFDCPRRYRHTYIDRPRPAQTGGPWAHLVLGNAVHLGLASWWDEPTERRTPETGAFLVAKAWDDTPFRDADHSAAWRARAMAWVRAYLEGVDPAARPVGIERTVPARERGMALEGRVDRIDLRTDGARERLVVVDYKTGHEPPADADAGSSIALAVYVLAAGRTLGVRCDRAELHHIPTGTVAAADYDRDRIDRHMTRLRDVADEIEEARQDVERAPDSADDIYPTRPGPLCASCPFRAICPTGQTVEPATPWQYLRDPEE